MAARRTDPLFLSRNCRGVQFICWYLFIYSASGAALNSCPDTFLKCAAACRRRRMLHTQYNVFIWRTIASCANQFVYLRDRSVIMLPAIKCCTRAAAKAWFLGVTRSAETFSKLTLSILYYCIESRRESVHASSSASCGRPHEVTLLKRKWFI